MEDKSPKEFYEEMRRLGLTDHITGDPNPNYQLPFYQNIFFIMDEYLKEHEGYNKT